MPVLEIVATGNPAPVGPFDGGVFVSEQAAGFAARLEFDRGAAIAAVGGATTRALAALSIDVTSTAASADALIATWRTTTTFRECHRVVLVKGEGGRKTLPQALARETEVVVWDAYRRVPKIVSSPDSIGVIVCSSGDGVRAMASADRARNQTKPVIVPSPRVAAIALELGYRNTLVTDGAAVEKVIAGLHEIVRFEREGDG